MEGDFEQITHDEINQTNDTPSSCFDGNTINISLPIGGIGENFIKDCYEEYHGSSPRFPGGNCVFASILTFMSYEKINNMVNYVLTKQKELDNEQLNDIIVQIFKNTPRTKNRDIISYMRAYVYIYLVENLNEYFKIGDTNPQLINLVNGDYTFIDKYTMRAFCEMTGTNILVFKENDFNALYNPILCSVENDKYSDERINIEDESQRNSIENYASSLQIGRDETDPTVKPNKFNNKDTISIFCFGRHCTPFVTGHFPTLVSVFNFFGITILANLFSLFNFFKPRLGAKEINTQKISNFVLRRFIMEKQFDGVKINKLILKFPKNFGGFFSESNSVYLDTLNDENDLGILKCVVTEDIKEYEPKENFSAIKLNKLDNEDDNYFYYEAQDVTIKKDKLFFQIFSHEENLTHVGFKTELHFAKNINEYIITYDDNNREPEHIKTIKFSKLDWKTIVAITAGIIFALGVAAVSALTFGWTLIPALLITKIAIGVGLALTIATFIYVAIKSKKIENDKCQNLGKSNSKDKISNNNDLGENNKNQKTDVPNKLQQIDPNKEL